MATMGHEIDVRDVEYLRHGDQPLLARMFVPRGDGPFPMIVELHGGAWSRGDRTNDTIMNEPLARSGVVVAALDFRQPPEASYPGSLVDISYAVRWLKSHAAEFHGRADQVGLMGASSGAHLAMLLAMKPRDPKYAAMPLPAGSPATDGSVRCAVLCWPVIDPLSRYRYAKALKAGGPPYPDVVDRVLPGHDAYWRTEEAMAEGNPTLALERGEAV
ncbi:MAG TPA: alpha/beta hydrolase, partial [Candidatus Udaeobacter sp.]|nr:alpha/beta hydrolase [Candidatus Udaeobacter sp.]